MNNNCLRCEFPLREDEDDICDSCIEDQQYEEMFWQESETEGPWIEDEDD